MASADFWQSLSTPLDADSTAADRQISPGIAHPPSRLCASDLRHHAPYMYRALHFLACLPHGAASIRFLFVAPALCFRLPSDSQSPGKPLPSANTCPCRPCKGLSPPSECALPGAQKKGPVRRSRTGPVVLARSLSLFVRTGPPPSAGSDPLRRDGPGAGAPGPSRCRQSQNSYFSDMPYSRGGAYCARPSVPGRSSTLLM
jgi:hypothetical protein